MNKKVLLKKKTLIDVIRENFKDSRQIYYNPGDLISDEHRLSYIIVSNERVILSIGTNDCGDMPCFICRKPEQLEKTIKFILFGADFI